MIIAGFITDGPGELLKLFFLANNTLSNYLESTSETSLIQSYSICDVSAIKQHDKLRIGDWLRTIDGQQVRVKTYRRLLISYLPRKKLRTQSIFTDFIQITKFLILLFRFLSTMLALFFLGTTRRAR